MVAWALPGAVTLNPAGGTFYAPVNVVFTCPTVGAVIHYTTNGAVPAETDPVIASGASLAVNSSRTYKAAAFAAGVSGAVATGNYLLLGKLAAGYGFSFAISLDGTLYSWGDNQYGQLGVGSFDPILVPSAMPTLSGVADVAGGWYHAVAAKSDGTVWCWGPPIDRVQEAVRYPYPGARAASDRISG